MVDLAKNMVLVNILLFKIVKEVRRFLGLMAYYKKLMKKHVTLATPINELIKKN